MGSAVGGFSFFAWRSTLWGRWLCDTEGYLWSQGHTHGRAKCNAFAVLFEVEGELPNVFGRQGISAMRQETLEFSVDNSRQSGDELRVFQMSAAHLNQIPVDERNPYREV
jgi:hypothetical protein